MIGALGTLLFFAVTPVLANRAAHRLGSLRANFFRLLVAVGLLGASLLAAGVLPLATAYPISEALGLERGVSRTFQEAPAFMGIFTGLIVLGVLLCGASLLGLRDLGAFLAPNEPVGP